MNSNSSIQEIRPDFIEVKYGSQVTSVKTIEASIGVLVRKVFSPFSSRSAVTITGDH